MGHGEAFRHYGCMSAQDRRAFDRWLAANAVIGSIFAAVLLLMALAESNLVGPRHAAADATTGQGAERIEQGVSPSDLTNRLAPDQLPVQLYNAF